MKIAKARNRSDRGARRGPTELSLEQLRGVSGGTGDASRQKVVNQFKGDSPKAVQRPSDKGRVIDGITVKSEWVGGDGKVRFGGRGNITGKDAVHAWQRSDKEDQKFNNFFKGFGKGFVNMAGNLTGIKPAVEGIKNHNVGQALSGFASIASNALGGAGAALSKVGSAAAGAVNTAGKAIGRVGTGIDAAQQLKSKKNR
jgi:hypothetical protein